MLHGKVKILQQAEMSFNSLPLLLSTAVAVPPLTSLPLFLRPPPFSCPAAMITSTIGSVQAGRRACPAEPYSAAHRLRGM